MYNQGACASLSLSIFQGDKNMFDKFEEKWLADPEVFRINQLPAHSDHRFYENEEAYGSDMNLRLSLDGQWDFAFAENVEEMKEILQSLGIGADAPAKGVMEGMGKIQVPGCIEMQGYGQIQYINTFYPWDGLEGIRPPMVPEHNPCGVYCKEVVLPENFRGRRLILTFEAASAALALYVNGHFAGYAEDSFTPSEFDITEFTGFTEFTGCGETGAMPANGTDEQVIRICAVVFKWSSASWIEDQDFFRFSGLFRSVYLTAIPRVHVEDIRVRTDLSRDYSAAKVLVDLRLGGQADKKNLVLKAILAEANGGFISYVMVDPGQIDQAGHLSFSLKLHEPKLWSCEKPDLYLLKFYVEDKDENLIEYVPVRFGVRRFEMKKGIMRLNGRRIIFRGVNRHEFDARIGRGADRESMLWDIKCMKRNNINADRTCHYPNNSLWYDLCDEYGIYLIDETNMESHGSFMKFGEVSPEWNVPGDKPEWLACVLDRARSMLERDKNHASVLIWSCGNESYANTDILAMHDYFRQADPDRLVHYESCFWNREFEACSDMESRMYALPADIKEYLDQDPKKPYISCEYMHAMGNSCGGLNLYMDLEDYSEKYQGGFIWDFIDQALWQKRGRGDDRKEYLVSGGFHDERPSDYGFSTNGIVYADRRESPKMQEVRQLYAPVQMKVEEDGVLIRNKNLFVDTSVYHFRAEILLEDELVWETAFDALVSPLSEEKVLIPFMEGIRAYLKDDTFDGADGSQKEFLLNVYALQKGHTAWAEVGHVISFGQKAIVIDPEDMLPDETVPEDMLTEDILTEEEVLESMPAEDNRSEETVTEDMLPVGEGTEVCAAEDDDVPADSRIVYGDGHIGVIGPEVQVLFSLGHGTITSLKKDGKEFLADAPKVVYWRATTDNDRGNGAIVRDIRYLALEMGQYHDRKSIKVREIRPDGQAINIDLIAMQQSDHNYSAEGNILEITVDFKAPMGIGKAIEEDGTIHTAVYRITPEGCVSISLEFKGLADMPPVPCFGMEFKLYDRLCSEMTYYGAGPDENYVDRRGGAALGIYEISADDNYSEYLKPQECGNRTGIRWLELRAGAADREEAADDGKNADSSALRITAISNSFMYGLAPDPASGIPVSDSNGRPAVEASLLPYNALEMEHAKLKDELPCTSYNYLRIYGAMSGVGGDDSWGSPVHDEYKISAGRKARVEFTMEPG